MEDIRLFIYITGCGNCKSAEESLRNAGLAYRVFYVTNAKPKASGCFHCRRLEERCEKCQLTIDMHENKKILKGLHAKAMAPTMYIESEKMLYIGPKKIRQKVALLKS